MHLEKTTLPHLEGEIPANTVAKWAEPKWERENT